MEKRTADAEEDGGAKKSEPSKENEGTKKSGRHIKRQGKRAGKKEVKGKGKKKGVEAKMAMKSPAESGEEDEGEEPVVPPEPVTSFEQLIMDVNYLVKEMDEKSGAVNYGTEYIRMFQNLHDVRENFSSMKSKIKELQDLRSIQQTEIETLKSFSEEQAKTIEKQRQQLVEIRAIADAAWSREQASLERVEVMREELSDALREIERGRALRGEVEVNASQEDLVKTLARDKELLLAKVSLMQERLILVSTLQSEGSEKIAELEEQMKSMVEDLDRERDAKRVESVRVKELTLETETLKRDLANTESALADVSMDLKAARRNIQDVEGILMERINLYRDLENKNAETERALEACEASLARQKTFLTKVTAQKDRAEDMLKQEVKVTRALNRKLEAMQREVDKCGIESNQAKRKVSNMVEQLNHARSDIVSYEKELQRTQTVISSLERKVKEVSQQKDLADGRLARQGQVLSEVTDSLMRKDTLIEGAKRIMKEEKSKCEKLALNFKTLLRSKDRLTAEIADLGLKLEIETEKVSLEQSFASRTKKDLEKAQAQLHLVETAKENVEMEKVRVLRQLSEEKSTTLDQRGKLRTLNYTIEQLSEETKSKQRELYLERKAHKKTEEERRHLASIVDALRLKISEQQEEVSKLGVELTRTAHHLQEADQKVAKVEREKQDAMNERDILGTQLVRRNDELKALRVKTGILEKLIAQGQIQYNERIDDLKIMRNELQRLKADQRQNSDHLRLMYPNLRKELYHTRMDLMRTQLECRATLEEAATPINVHRWRKLQSTCPTMTELLAKVSTLQKRILAKDSALSRKDEELKEAQCLYAKIREAFARRPVSDESLMRTRIALNKRDRKLKSLKAEVRILVVELATQKRNQRLDLRISSSTSALPPIKPAATPSFRDDQTLN